MSEQRYKASLSRSQGREGWSVIFRHPVRRDEATGKPGKRVRRGLSTRDETEALKLIGQIDELLLDRAYWDPAARVTAEGRFDPRAVDIFFHKMLPEDTDSSALRDRALPLPAGEFRRVLLLGTTGAGKTTLVRQLMGTDPDREKFPSTSTAKTTIADTEIILDGGAYRAVVTFLSRDEVRDSIEECLAAAVLAAHRKAPDAEVLRRLLLHVNQRFRLTYILGNGPEAEGIDEADLDEQDEPAPLLPEELGAIDIEATNEVLSVALTQIRQLALRHGEAVSAEVGGVDKSDERVFDELVEEVLDARLREDEAFHEIADQLMEEVEKRFDLLRAEDVQRSRQGWPISWQWETSDRRAFITAVLRFSSNYAPLFGRLLTPLVNGIRVAGPFGPSWQDGSFPKLVLLDGEGLGHTPASSAAIPTSVSRRLTDVDAVLLTDSAAQPMQAAPVAAMRALAASGQASKLLFCFTQFDRVTGDNLPNLSAREQHVLASAENALATIAKDLGPAAERALRGRLAEGRFFLGGIHEALEPGHKGSKRTISQLSGLLEAIDRIVERPEPVPARPVYERLNLVLAVKAAAESFRDHWLPRLGLAESPGVAREHWSRIKALSRGLAQGWRDEYGDLKPVAQLHELLQNQVYVLIQAPIDWVGPEPAEADKTKVFDMLLNAISGRLLGLATRRVKDERIQEWQEAYSPRGWGSTRERARIIAGDVYERAAPVPDLTPTPERNRFLHEVVAAVEEAAQQVGAELR